MRRAVFSIIVVLFAAASVSAQGAPHGSQPTPTRHTVLAIPFRISATNNPTHQPVEVQLFVSANRGASWIPAGAVRPEAGKIIYRAARDGEYWFCVRTKDVSGNIRPSGIKTPGLRVLVDTAKPKLRLDVWRGINGDVTARWDVFDSSLNPQSLKIESRRSGSNDAWTPLTVNRRRSGQPNTSYLDSVTWKSATPVEVRVAVSDTAGNVAQQTAKAGVSSANGGSRRSPGDFASPRTAAAQADQPRQPNPPARSTPWPEANAHSRPLTTNQTGQPGPANSASPGSGAFTDPFYAPGSSNRSLGETTNDGMVRNPASRGVTPDIPPLRPLGATGIGAMESRDSTWPTNPRTNNTPIRATSVPDGKPKWLVNTSSFELSYDLGAVPQADLRAVELWGTRDGGQSWRRFSIDEDRHSPMVVRAEGEGVYGFRLLLQRQNGPVELPPRRGESPDLWVEVDQTAPFCQLTQVDQFGGVRGNQLIISWEARDPNLAQRPITLKYSHRPRGPWRTIESGLENTGSYVWLMKGAVPAKIYFRLEVRDAAENVGVFTASERAVEPDRAPSQGRLHGVAPVTPVSPNRTSDLRTTGRMYYFR